MLMSATKIVIKYHFKIHSICICKAHLLSCKIHSAVHHVFSLEFVAVIFLVVIIIQLLKWNLMSSPDLYGAWKLCSSSVRAALESFSEVLALVCIGLMLAFPDHHVPSSLPCAAVEDRQAAKASCWCSPLQTALFTTTQKKSAWQIAGNWYVRDMLNRSLLPLLNTFSLNLRWGLCMLGAF